MKKTKVNSIPGSSDHKRGRESSFGQLGAHPFDAPGSSMLSSPPPSHQLPAPKITPRDEALGRRWPQDSRWIGFAQTNRKITRTDAESIYQKGSKPSGYVYRSIHIPIGTLLERWDKTSRLEEHILNALPKVLQAPKPNSGSLVVKHIGNSGGSFLSTSKNPQRAAMYASHSWNCATVDLGKLKSLKNWSPVVKIDLSKAATGGPIYDMTDEMTRAAVLAMEVTHGQEKDPALNGVIGNALLDEEVILSRGIPRDAIVQIIADWNEISQTAHGPGKIPGLEMVANGRGYTAVNPQNLGFVTGLMDKNRRPKWASELRTLHSRWCQFSRTTKDAKALQQFFADEVDTDLEEIYGILADPKNQDRLMAPEEMDMLSHLLQVKANHYGNLTDRASASSGGGFGDVGNHPGFGSRQSMATGARDFKGGSSSRNEAKSRTGARGQQPQKLELSPEEVAWMDLDYKD